jgi:prepilin-type N-terminal cleavage/methylation domain-containing protein
MKKGFTLLEILLVIAAIGLLAAIVIIAINPNRQLAQVRDTERVSEINAISKALDQYLIDNGEFPGSVSSQNEGVYDICLDTSLDCSGYIDLSSLVPTYIASIPQDPSINDIDDSGYSIYISSDAELFVLGLNYEIQPISATGSLPSEAIPFSVPGLIAWYDAQDSAQLNIQNGNQVQNWYDKSGVGNTSGWNSPSSRRPTFVSSGINGFPEVRFNSAQEQNLWTPIVNYSGELTVLAVVRTSVKTGLNNDSNFMGNVHWSGSGSPSNRPGFSIITENWSTDSPSLGTFFGTSQSGEQEFIRTNGINQSPTSFGAHLFTIGISEIQSTSHNLIIGNRADYGVGNAFHGGIGEILLFNRLLTEAELELLENSLLSKWGLQIL